MCTGTVVGVALQNVVLAPTDVMGTVSFALVGLNLLMLRFAVSVAI